MAETEKKPEKKQEPKAEPMIDIVKGERKRQCRLSDVSYFEQRGFSKVSVPK